MVATKSIFVALLCAVAQLSSAATLPVERETADLRTNAARLAAGLNPLTPRGLERMSPIPVDHHRGISRSPLT